MLLLEAGRASLWLRERGELDSGKFLLFSFHLTLVLLTSLHLILSTGCILGGSALGSPRSSGEAVGKKAAEELLEAVETGGCVDKYIQVRKTLVGVPNCYEYPKWVGNLTRKTPASAVEIFVQDQMIIFMALADGESRLLCGPLTLHTETAIHIAEKMTGAKFKVGLSGKPEA